MDAVTWALLALGAVACVMGWMQWRHVRSSRRLQQELQALLADDQRPLAASLAEGSFALLENTLKDLVLALRRARALRAEDAQQTSDMLMRLSHQLKTPLSGLKMYEEMAPGPYSGKQRQLLERMEHLLDMLLKLEKLRAGGYRMRFAACDVSQPLKAAWARLKPLWPGVTLHIVGSGTARMDRDWMEEAFLNLLNNACEQMPEGGEISVQISSTSSALHLLLMDTAGGVAQDDLPRLFDRFYTSPGRKSGGAGIGLSMVREIMRAHHGEITAQRTEHGLCFSVVLPHLSNDLTVS